MDNLSYDQMESLAIRSTKYEYQISEITPKCKANIAKKFHIPEVVLDAYLLTENSVPGHIRSNSDDSWDVGPMQINNVNWNQFYTKFKINPIAIRFNGCINLMAGAYIIRQHLDVLGKDKITGWKAFFKVAANYHSKTPIVNKRYQKKWVQNFNTVLEGRTNAK